MMEDMFITTDGITNGELIVNEMYQEGNPNIPVPIPSTEDNGKVIGVVDGVYELTGANLPAVTEADNGKILRVVDADWEAESFEGASVSDVQDMIYDALPVDMASGAVANFPDGADGAPLKIKAEIEPVQNLNGQSAPYPAGGGKNLMPTIPSPIALSGVTVESTADGEIWIHGTPDIASGYIALNLGISLPNSLLNQTITVSVNEKTDGIGFTFGAGGALNLTMGDTVTTKTGTVSVHEACHINVRYDVGAINKKYKVQVEKGSLATTWSPYSNICPITGYSSVDVSRCGKNLLNWSQFYSYAGKARCTASQADDGTVTVSVTQTGSVWVGDNTSIGNTISASAFKIRAKKGDVFTSSYSVDANIGTTLYEVDAKGVRLSNGGRCPYTVENDACAWVVVRFIFGTKTSGDEFTFIPQIELGEESTDYVPYNGITKTISLGSTIYGGILNVDSGVLTVTKGKHTVASGDSTSLFQTGDNANRVGIPVSDAVAGTDAATRLLPICNIAQASSTVPFSAETQALGYCALYNKILLVCVPTTATDADAAKSWLVSNGCEFVYPLATPTTIQLTGEEITALLGENNVWANSGDVEVTYSADIGLYVDKKLGTLNVSMVATENYSDGEYFMVGNELYIATASIASGETIVPGTNATLTNIADALNSIGA